MNRLQEARRPALNIEEAALLPARMVPPMAGAAALSAARRAEAQMKGMTLGTEIPWGREANDAPAAALRRQAPRAALNHVLGNKKGTAARAVRPRNGMR